MPKAKKYVLRKLGAFCFLKLWGLGGSTLTEHSADTTVLEGSGVLLIDESLSGERSDSDSRGMH